MFRELGTYSFKNNYTRPYNLNFILQQTYCFFNIVVFPFGS